MTRDFHLDQIATPCGTFHYRCFGHAVHEVENGKAPETPISSLQILAIREPHEHHRCRCAYCDGAMYPTTAS